LRWLLDPFSTASALRALVAGLLAVVASSAAGTWMVVRRLGFLADALAHGVIPGIALAMLWGTNLVAGAFVSAAVMVLGIGVVDRRSHLGEDSAIGLLFVGMLALGVLVATSESSDEHGLEELLFGNIGAIAWSDVLVQGVIALLVVAATALGYRALLALAFNEAKAASLGLRPGSAHLLLLAVVAMAIVSSYQAVGTLLVFGLLVGPPATAALLVRRVWVCMLVAAGLGSFAVVSGLVVSYHADSDPGATISGIAVVTFFLVLAGKELVRAVRPPVPTAALPT
jgi:ABC-type Mn2+/Zn2+ transport system permease subunit